MERFLYIIEKGGNALPHPAVLFGILALTVLALSALGAILGWSGMHPGTGNPVDVVNLLSREGIHRVILGTVTNFTSFAPLGVVLVAMLGIGIADTSGLIRATINYMLAKTPPTFITLMVVFVGVLSSVAVDVGYVLVIPLAGAIFHSLGRHPIAGIAAGFAGVSGGFAANIVIAPLDPMLAGLSTEAAQIIDPDYHVLPTAYYYFMVVSTFLITLVCTIVTVKWVEPRLGKYTGDAEREELVQLTALEKKGLFRVGLVLLCWLILMLIVLVPENGLLRCNDGTLLHSPALRGIITLLFLIAASVGIVYGFTVGTFKKTDDVVNAMGDSMKTIAAYLVLVFFMAQFVAWFNWSNLGMLLAIGGASVLQNAEVGPIPLIIIFITLTAFINLFIGSASAKWAILAPIFVPIFMLSGYSPELAQTAYSIGDGVTTIITPLMPYFALIIVFCQKYVNDAGIGTIAATMLPYTICLYVSWTLLLVIWVLLELPLGPGSPLYYVITNQSGAAAL